MIIGGLVSNLLLSNILSHVILIASAPASPVKKPSKGLKMVSSSSVVPTSLEKTSRSFGEPGK